MAEPTVNLSPVLARFAQAVDAGARSGGGDPAPAAFGAVLEQVLADGLAAGHKGEVAAT